MASFCRGGSRRDVRRVLLAPSGCAEGGCADGFSGLAGVPGMVKLLLIPHAFFLEAMKHAVIAGIAGNAFFCFIFFLVWEVQI